MVEKVKKRRVAKKDWDYVQSYVKKEYDTRKTSQYRKRAEEIWKEVDRQVCMEAPRVISKDDSDYWHSSLELGELSKASEVYSADFNRITFPSDKWFEAHVRIDSENQDEQEFMDGALRALMVQQHKDFGFKKRVNLTIKEAFHHGSFGVEVLDTTLMRFPKGTGVGSKSAPVWVPHSMWNTFPDPSPSVSHGGLFYDGSMIFRSFMPLGHLKKISGGPGWMGENIKKIPKKTNKNKDIDTEDVELLTYYGDLDIPRNDGNIFLPNSKVILANGVIVYWSENETDFVPVIYDTYEKLDVRDPYGVSPLMKFSPMQKLATILANKTVDIISVHGEPPIVWDSNDPQLIAAGGPDRSPNASTAMKNLGNIAPLPTGDPNAVLSGLEMALLQLQSGTGTDAPRVGGGDNVEKTAFEVRKTAQGGQLRIIDFIGKFERNALVPFLLMQHELNLKKLKSYVYYNPELDSEDFQMASKKDLPEKVHFEITGSKGVLGEEERRENTFIVLDRLAQSPETAKLLDTVYITKHLLEEAGNKNPERFLLIKSKEDETSARIKSIQEQAEQQISEMEEQFSQVMKKMDEIDKKNMELEVKIAAKDGKIATLEEQIQLEDKINQDLKVLNENKLVLDDISDKLKLLEEAQISAERKQADAQKVLDQVEKKKTIKIEKDETGQVTGAVISE